MNKTQLDIATRRRWLLAYRAVVRAHKAVNAGKKVTQRTKNLCQLFCIEKEKA